MNTPPSSWVAVAKVSDLAHDGTCHKFLLRSTEGYLLESFIVRQAGEFFAYVNRCPHMPLSLDYGDGEFFDETHQWLICRNHGAVFDPKTGRCVMGPCCGASLEKMMTRITGDFLEVLPPTYNSELE